MSYDLIDSTLKKWQKQHKLDFQSVWGEASRCAYLSSEAGECFQIWIEIPERSKCIVHAACVEGRRDLESDADFVSSISDFENSLDKAYAQVLEWMKPSNRYLVKKPRVLSMLRHLGIKIGKRRSIE